MVYIQDFTEGEGGGGEEGGGRRGGTQQALNSRNSLNPTGW